MRGGRITVPAASTYCHIDRTLVYVFIVQQLFQRRKKALYQLSYLVCQINPFTDLAWLCFKYALKLSLNWFIFRIKLQFTCCGFNHCCVISHQSIFWLLELGPGDTAGRKWAIWVFLTRSWSLESVRKLNKPQTASSLFVQPEKYQGPSPIPSQADPLRTNRVEVIEEVVSGWLRHNYPQSVAGQH